MNLDDAILRNATLEGADLVKASLHGVDASGAGCRGTRFMGSSLLGADFRGADLSDAVFDENSFQVKVDEETKLEGAAGSVFGPVTFVREGVSRELSGSELQQWIRDHGGEIRVLGIQANR
ncbi:pentapeptide repeat-containing protein [Streptomyces chilikensis]|uniref:Pentapeptide repeat-containing protein n=1 Tax=Streptomyces chilikensis TaxID=1194079 RepID=A0ABV3EU99_9ACTN